MQIRLGYELVYDCPQPTPMLLMLNIHHSRVADIVTPDPLSPAHPWRSEATVTLSETDWATNGRAPV
jgi:hypothetical protein